MTEKRASHLLDEPPILVYPTLAKALGINKAIIFQQLHYLMNVTKNAHTLNNFVDGRWWVYNSYPQWQRDYFPWLSTGAIKRLFLELERDGFVLAKQSVKSKADRRKWYSIDYTRWEQFVTTIGTNCDHTPSAQNETMDSHKMSQSIGTNLANEVPESTAKTTPIDKKKESSAKAPRPKKAQPYDDVDGEARKTIITAWLNALPQKPTTNEYAKTTNHNLAAGIARAGYCAADVERYVKAQYQDKFWQGKFLGLDNIAKNLPIWLKKQSNTPPTVSAPPSPTNGVKPPKSLKEIQLEQMQQNARRQADLKKASGQ